MGRPKLPVTEEELQHIRDSNALHRTDKQIAVELGWSLYRVAHYRNHVLGLPSAQDALRTTHNQEESNN